MRVFFVCARGLRASDYVEHFAVFARSLFQPFFAHEAPFRPVAVNTQHQYQIEVVEFRVFDQHVVSGLADFNFKVLELRVFGFSCVKNSLQRFGVFSEFDVDFVNEVHGVAVAEDDIPCVFRFDFHGGCFLC